MYFTAYESLSLNCKYCYKFSNRKNPTLISINLLIMLPGEPHIFLPTTEWGILESISTMVACCNSGQWHIQYNCV